MSGSRYRISDQYATHFITCTIVDWVDVFTRRECRELVVDSLNFCVDKKELEVYAWCLMSNHIHLVVRAANDAALSDIIRDFKKWTARGIITWLNQGAESRKEWMEYRFRFHGKFRNNVKEFHVWTDDNHPILLTTSELFFQKVHYTHMNPVRAGIVDTPEHYLHSSARDYCGQKGLVTVAFHDFAGDKVALPMHPRQEFLYSLFIIHNS